jgi:serine/threonine-protein kinase
MFVKDSAGDSTSPNRSDVGSDLSQPPVVDPGGSSLPEEPNGRYRTGPLLGQGGMGEVRVVTDGRVGREVAMKVMRSGRTATSDEVFRFLREARVQGQLEHPAIAPVYDLGRSPDGSLFFTMKRVRGTPMNQVIRALAAGDAEMARRFTARKLLQAFAAVCQAVEFAHARGALHRDLKPSNVMLGEFGEVTVLDWGLAKAIGRRAASASSEGEGRPPAPADLAPLAESAAVTRMRPSGKGGTEIIRGGGDHADVDAAHTLEGSMLGTPGYMAPEQAYGHVDALDARTDVYALGALLFELLTFEPLHPRGNVDELYASMMAGADARPSARAPAREVPPEFDAICVRATAAKKDDRYPTVRALLEDVERYLDGDRDLERRRELAAEHARAAADLCERALGPSCSAKDRADAMREVGRALALDPGNELALRSMVRMLVEPPRDLPAEVSRSLRELQVVQLRKNAVDAAFNCCGGLLVAPLFLLQGIRDATLFVVYLALLAAATAAFYFLGRGEMRASKQIVQFCVCTAALGVLARTLGPLWILPTVMAIQAASFALTPFRTHRAFFAAGSLLTVVVPVVLEQLGVIEPSYVFHDGALTIVPHMLWLPEKTIFVLLALLPVFVLMPVRTVGRTIDTLWGLQTRLELQAWHLRQLVPDAAHGTMAESRR